MHDDPFRHRLADAIAALTEAQRAALQSRAPGARGIKAAIAEVAGLPGANVLSDILAGRVPGTKHRDALAGAVAVPLAWLEGTSEDPPDWAMLPVAAWRRWHRRLSDAVARRRLTPRARDDSSRAGGAGESRLRGDQEILARQLGLQPRDPSLAHLFAGRFADVPAEILFPYAALHGLADPVHREHLERGRQLWSACESEFQRQLAQGESDLKRLLPPPPLFRLMRAALVEMRLARQYQGKPTGEVEDALEVLWRQEWFLLGRSRREVPEAFTQETGRAAWTRLRQIHERYAGDGDAVGRYRSKRAGDPVVQP